MVRTRDEAQLEVERGAGNLRLAHRLDEAFAIETQCTKDNAATDDAKEGPRAFMEKRAPVWTGRRPG